MTDEGIELILTVMEAKELIGPANAEKFDTFVRIYMVPDDSGALQTKVCKRNRNNEQLSESLATRFSCFFFPFALFLFVSHL